MKHRIENKSKILSITSNAAFLAPALLLYSQSRYLLAGMLFLVMIVSTVYHTTKPAGPDSPWIPKPRTKAHLLLLWSDVLLTIAVGIYVFFVHLLPLVPNDSLEFEFATILFLIGFLLYAFPKNKYEIKHSLWHMLAAGALCIVFL